MCPSQTPRPLDLLFYRPHIEVCANPSLWHLQNDPNINNNQRSNLFHPPINSIMKERTLCPECQSSIDGNPALFSFKEIRCEQCQQVLRTNLNARLLHILSFGLLALYYLAVRQGVVTAQNTILTLGLIGICLPLILAIFLPRYEKGQQDALHSIAINAAFYLTVMILAALWLLR